MVIRERYEGSRFPFEGDRVLVLGSLPEGAKVSKVTVLLEPVAPPGGTLFEETLAFTGDQGEWGARKRETGTFAEVDFHARRTLSSVAGTGLSGATLQVDLGGLYVPINSLGAMSSPDDGVDDFVLVVPGGGLLPALATQQFQLSKSTAATVSPGISAVGIRSTPANLSLRLGSQPPFWARPGELARSETVPDFSEVLNAFLTEAKARDGYYEILLTLHSDSLCRLTATIEIDYVRKTSALPGGLAEARLKFDYGTVAAATDPRVVVRIPAGAKVLAGETRARVRGSFADSRIVFGPTGALEPKGTVTLSPDRAQALPLIATETLAFSSLDLLLAAKSRTAELAVDLVEDNDGKPYTRSLLPNQAKLSIDSQTGGRPAWVNVPLAREVQIPAGTRLWLVLQSLSGEAGWSVAGRSDIASAVTRGAWTAGAGIAADQANGVPLGLLYTDTGGLAWRQETAPGIDGPLVSFVHLRQPPASFRVPLSLEVGQGEAARRVSLERFQPLGRVDFALDFAEFADAINQVAAAKPTVPAGEHLANGELEDWRRVGDTPAESLVRFPFLQNKMTAVMAANPDGRLLHLVVDLSSGFKKAPSMAAYASNGLFALATMDATCLKEMARVELPEGIPEAVSVSPDGRRAGISLQGIGSFDAKGENQAFPQQLLVWVDLEQSQVLGSADLGKKGYFWIREPGRMLFSPDGSRLYFRSYSQLDLQYGEPAGAIVALNVAALEQALEETSDAFNIWSKPGLVETVVDWEDTTEPVDFAISPDGGSIYVLTAEKGENEKWPTAVVRAYDSGTWAEVIPGGVGLGDYRISEYYSSLSSGALTLNHDGSRLVAVKPGSGEVAVVVVPNGILVGQTVLSATAANPLTSPSNDLPAVPIAVAVHPDDNYAVIADYLGKRLIAFDIARLRETRSLEVADYFDYGPHPMALDVLAGGERVFAACRGGTSPSDLLVALPFGTLVPEEWSLTQGRIQRLCAPDPFHFAAVLGDFTVVSPRLGRGVPPVNRPSAISQVVPVAGGASYVLSFWGLASTPEAVAEIFWYAGDCGVQRADRLPFSVLADGPSSMLQGLQEVLDNGGTLKDTDVSRAFSHRLSVQSPNGAEQAEIRISVPANEAAVFDRVSLKATADALANGDLRHIEAGRLAGWLLTPKDAAGVVVTAEAEGLRIRNNGNKEVALEQAAGFRAGVPFELGFAGVGEASPGRAEPRLELAFLDGQGGALGDPLRAAIAAEGSDRLVRSGDSPAGTAASLVRLVVPAGAGLLARQIALEEVAMVEVPLNFIAEAPGEIHLADLQVVYERAPAAVPAKPPAATVCPPTPPAGAEGKTGSCCCYCPCCGETDELVDVEETATPAGQAAIEGDCRHCGTRQQQISGGTAAPAAPSPPPQAPPPAGPGLPAMVKASVGKRGREPVVVSSLPGRRRTLKP